MSELTTDQALGFVADGPRGQVRGGKQVSTAEMINHELAARWEMCCEAVGIDTDATAAEWREAYEAKRAGERRKAKIEWEPEEDQ